jgi:hypothetical protein
MSVQARCVGVLGGQPSGPGGRPKNRTPECVTGTEPVPAAPLLPEDCTRGHLSQRHAAALRFIQKLQEENADLRRKLPIATIPHVDPTGMRGVGCRVALWVLQPWAVIFRFKHGAVHVCCPFPIDRARRHDGLLVFGK